MSTVLPVVRIDGVSRVFARRDAEQRVLDGLSLDVAAGTFVCLLGRSGCGKSTLLNMIAGLIAPSAGRITIDDTPVSGPRATVGYLTQKDTLLPWRDVQRNVEMPLEIRNVVPAERAARALDVIARVGLQGREHAYPRELSGGMARRASLARLLIADPEVLLLDEPFSALDAQLRAEMQNELLRLWSGSGKTVIFVTHDLEEAIALADKVVVVTASPGTVKATFDVDLPRPRGAVQEIRFGDRFRELHHQIWDALREEVQRAYARTAGVTGTEEGSA